MRHVHARICIFLAHFADVARGRFYQAVIVVCAGGKFDFFCKWGRIGVADKGGETLKTYGTQVFAVARSFAQMPTWVTGRSH